MGRSILLGIITAVGLTALAGCRRRSETTAASDAGASAREAAPAPQPGAKVGPSPYVPMPNDPPRDLVWYLMRKDVDSASNAADIRVKAIDFMKTRGCFPGVPALISCLDDDRKATATERAVSYHAREALKAIAGQDFEYDQRRWSAWWAEDCASTPTDWLAATSEVIARVRVSDILDGGGSRLGVKDCYALCNVTDAIKGLKKDEATLRIYIPIHTFPEQEAARMECSTNLPP